MPTDSTSRVIHDKPVAISGLERTRKLIYRGFDMAERQMQLLLAQRGHIVPGANRPPRAADAVLVLHRTGNPTTDYYLGPRLSGLAVPVIYADIERAPALYPELGQARALFVIVCRYMRRRWIRFLEEQSARIARVAYFADDDMQAVLTDRALGRLVRGKVAAWYSPHVKRLSALTDELWVSTPHLAELLSPARAVVLDPIPTEEPPPPCDGDAVTVFYHSTEAHRAERAFVIELARRAQNAGLDVDFEITGDQAEAALAQDLPRVRIAPQTDWLTYRAQSLQRSLAIGLAPLFPTPANSARSHVKAFDIARLGAAGLFADAASYKAYVRDGEDGLLLPMREDAWLDAITRLAAEPQRRRQLAANARNRQRAIFGSANSLPGIVTK